MDGYAVAAGPAARARGGRRGARGPSRRGARPAGDGGAHLHRRGRARRGRRRRTAGERRGSRLPTAACACRPSAAGENVRYPGEDVPAGRRVLRSGTLLGPAELGVARLGGPAGAALQPPAPGGGARDRRRADRAGRRARAPGGIYSSNAFALAAQVERAGAQLVMRRTVPDSPRGDARGDRAGPGRGRRGDRLRRRIGGPARPREGRARASSGWRSASGACCCGRASRPGSARTASGRSCSACPATPYPPW